MGLPSNSRSEPMIQSDGDIINIMRRISEACFKIHEFNMPKWSLILLLTLQGAVHAQGALSLTFEVASFRESSPLSPREERPPDGVRSGGPGTSDPAVVRFSRVPLNLIVSDAFDIPWNRVYGPDWMASSRYDILANVPAGSTSLQVATMLQNLLKERLHVAVHVEKRTFQGYSLTISPQGLKLTEAKPKANPGAEKNAANNDPFPPLAEGERQAMRYQAAPERIYARFRETSMAEFASWLGQRFQGGVAPGSTGGTRVAPVNIVDKTGLKGGFSFTFMYEGFYFVPDKTTIESALEKELGLALVPSTLSLDVLVIDSAKRTPEPN